MGQVEHTSFDRYAKAKAVLSSYDQAPWNVAQSSLADALRTMIAEIDAEMETS